ncbi:hypothetical protein ACFU8Q_06815 [Streptomyces sp. NPDC057543]
MERVTGQVFGTVEVIGDVCPGGMRSGGRAAYAQVRVLAGWGGAGEA